MAVRCEQVPVVEFLDSANHGVHVFSRLVGIMIPADEPHQVVETGIALTYIAAPAAALLLTVRQGLFHPSFIGSHIAEVNWR
ncbi:MAG TPA: hypothetical protein VH601_23050 [Bryobacteraceae bacterium]